MHYLLALYMALCTHKQVNTTTVVTKTTYATNADLVVKHLGAEAPPAIALLTKESGLNECKINGGAVDCNYNGDRACGMVQSLPCQKLTAVCNLGDVECQIEWFKDYVHRRYGGAQGAWEHSLAYNWY